jgi:hypothetical protein
MNLRLAVLAAVWMCAAGCAKPDFNHDAWQFRTRRPWMFAGHSDAFTPVVKDDVVFFCGGYFWNEWDEIVALTATDGRLRWRVPLGSCTAPPVILGSTIVAIASQDHGSKHEWYGVDAASGRTLWTRDFGETAFRSSLGGFLYASASDGLLRRVNAAGDVETIELDGARGRMWIAESDRGLLAGARDAVWRIPDAAARPVRTATLQARIEWVDAAVAGGDLLILEDRDNRLLAFNVGDGRVVWTRRWTRVLGAPALLAAPIHGAPAMADRRLFVNTLRRRSERRADRGSADRPNRCAHSVRTGGRVVTGAGRRSRALRHDRRGAARRARAVVSARAVARRAHDLDVSHQGAPCSRTLTNLSVAALAL